ncbi:MAG: DUF2290 domain-containing protein [Verrucomicrobia bacterium]|nr:DUF2290 domain-containing protein [Verrucomicrobiota bacterium]
MASPEFEQLNHVLVAMRSIGLLWESNYHESIVGDGVRYIDAKPRDSTECPEELKELYSKVKEGWGNTSGMDSFISRDITKEYTVKFIDSALAEFKCTFRNDQLIKQRITYKQSPFFKSYESEDLYAVIETGSEVGITEYWQLFGVKSPTISELVSFRVDYDPSRFEAHKHPRTHLHLSDREDCRICVDTPLDPRSFFVFVVSHFYSSKRDELIETLSGWENHTRFPSSIEDEESTHIHLNLGHT